MRVHSAGRPVGAHASSASEDPSDSLALTRNLSGSGAMDSILNGYGALRP